MKTEGPLEKADASGERIEKLLGFVEFLAQQSKEKDGVPLLSTGRINMAAFKNVHRDVAVDETRATEWKKFLSKEDPNKETGMAGSMRDGEKLEMLAYIIFSKNLGDQFVVARASDHDDRVNKADTILLEKATGNLICALDEVSDISGGEYQKKQELVLSRNKKSGASIKYGFRTEKSGGAQKLILTQISGVPIFYLALPKEKIEQALADFVPSKEHQSEIEKKLFAYFLATMDAQLKGLELISAQLDNSLKQRLATLGKLLPSLKNKQV